MYETRSTMALILETDRLLLRNWEEKDFGPYHAMNNDPVVCEYFPDLQTEAQSRSVITRYRAQEQRDGYSFQPLIERATGAFIGDIGLAKVEFDAGFRGATEIGWMMQRQFWGRGYATEMARALLDHAFDVLGLPEVVAFTVPANAPSRRVMERLGMVQDEAAGFDHPNIAAGHPLRRHVLYRATAPSSQQAAKPA